MPARYVYPFISEDFQVIRSLKFSTPVVFACILSGCVMNQSQKPAPVEPAQPAQPAPIQTPPPSQTLPTPPQITQPQPQDIPQPPKLTSINWQTTIQPLVNRMMNTQGITPGSVLLVDRLKNSTNGSVQSGDADVAISQALQSNSKFTLVTNEQLNQAKAALGLSPNDSLNSRSKAIGLAHNLNAQYVLYSTARGDAKSPKIQMELMLVQTGEIVWSGSGNAAF